MKREIRKMLCLQDRKKISRDLGSQAFSHGTGKISTTESADVEPRELADLRVYQKMRREMGMQNVDTSCLSQDVFI